ncbi:uncharacterized protein LOC110177018 [Drosophila serrata]|uniref:uncharacterized protein LOC110177018 n=1 Tax=Drosophila serrata TaxID=7274 RepID=UPI000A1D249A|nr:uncharacterized protein LOC110177018 [Drosophila serrata]
MPKNITKKTLKPKIIRKKKRTISKKVPKTNPKQQSVLKNLFVTQRTNIKKRSSGTRRPSAPPQNQQVWRRTVLRNKPKPKPKDKLPRLFRMDDQTGLPVDYEQTVERVMHYVNPHLSCRPNTDLMMEELLTNMFMDVVQQRCPYRKAQTPTHMCCQNGRATGGMCCRDHQTKHYLQSLLKTYPCCLDEPIKQSTQEANEDLSDFHSACKRGPRQISAKLGPTQASKFNFNQLRIRSQ